MANQRPSHDRELLIQSLEKSLCEDSGDTCQLISTGLGKKKVTRLKKKTYSGDGRSTRTGRREPSFYFCPTPPPHGRCLFGDDNDKDYENTKTNTKIPS